MRSPLVLALSLLALPGGVGAATGPPRAYAPVVLHPLPRQALVQCRLAQASTPVRLLCPRRVPVPTMRTTFNRAVRPHATRLRVMGRGPGRASAGVELGYGIPHEPGTADRRWRGKLWQNRPCCFLHFEIFRYERGRATPPPGSLPATFAGRRGLYAPARSLGMNCPGNGGNFCNHAAFFFREAGVRYIATLHYFGPGATRALLGRLVAQLVPVASLPTPAPARSRRPS